MRRRDLLKATGLAAVADLEAVAEHAAGARAVVPDDPEYRAVFARLPVPAETPDGRYDLTLARHLNEDVLQAPELLGDAGVYANLVSRRATLTMGLDVPHGADATVDELERRGFDHIETIEGRPLFGHRSRYVQRVALVDDRTVVLGRSAELTPVASLARSLAVPRAAPLEQRLPAVSEVCGCLGRGAVLSLSPEGGRSTGESVQPVATGSRLSLRTPGGRLRTVAVYESAAAGRTALDRTGGSIPDGTAVTRDGAAVVTDRSVPEQDLPLAE